MSASRRRLSEPAGAAAREARSRSEGFRLEQISTRFAAGLDLPAILKGAQWFRPLPSARRLKPGAVPKQSLTVPQAHAQRILRGIVRFVADLPADSSPIVVWESAGSQLWVDTSAMSIACTEGVIGISVKVGCDELPEGVTVVVPFSVGTAQRPSGLVMATIDRLDGPDLVVARWSNAITAFAWESLLEVASRLCAGLGRDSRDLPLIPGSIAAGPGTLLISPMSRHDLSGLRG